MIDAMITSRTRRKLLAFFVLNAGVKFYLREIAKEIDEAAHSTRMELILLERAGFVSKSGLARQKFYLLNEDYSYLREIRSIVAKLRSSDFKEFDFTDHRRKALLEKNLDHIKRALVLKYRPQKIILFGSLAKGKVRSNTDIDLLVIKETYRPYNDRLREIVDICDYDVGVDFLVYNPEEFKELSRTNAFVRNEIIRNGEVIYDKAA